MVERNTNWINLCWFNLDIGTESMAELHFTCVELRVVVISGLNPLLRRTILILKQMRNHFHCIQINFKHKASNKTEDFCNYVTIKRKKLWTR